MPQALTAVKVTVTLPAMGPQPLKSAGSKSLVQSTGSQPGTLNTAPPLSSSQSSTGMGTEPLGFMMTVRSWAGSTTTGLPGTRGFDARLLRSETFSWLPSVPPPTAWFRKLLSSGLPIGSISTVN